MKLMKISQYQILLNDNQLPILMEERSHDYSISENGLTNPMAFAEMLNSAFQAGKRAEEYVWVIALNIKCTPIAVFEVAHGGFTFCEVSPREIFTRLCLCGSTQFVLAHNHPSGDLSPSNPDIDFTNKLIKLGTMMNIPLLDHIILGNDNYFSFHKHNLIK